MRIKKLLLLIAIVFCACAPSETADIFTFALSGEPDTLDPHATTGTLTFQVTKSIYDTLFTLGKNGDIIPQLARTVTVQESEILITLKDDIYFHHGKLLKAEDVIESLKRLRSEDFSSPSAAEYEQIERIDRIDDTMLIIRLAEPYVPIIATLASGWSAILPADLIAQGHNFAQDPVGTGPFKLREWRKGFAIELERNDTYRNSAMPKMDAVHFALISDTTTRTQALMNGEVHAIDLVVEPELGVLRKQQSITVDTSLSSLVLVIALNHRKEILQDAEFRKAINAAIDKERVMEIAYGGGAVVDTFMDPNSLYYSRADDNGNYDPEFAAEVFLRKQPEQPLVISIPQNFEPHKKAGELYADMLLQVGLETRLELLEWATWLSRVYRQAQFDMTVIGHTGKLDPDGRLLGYGSPDTYVGWIDSEVVSLLALGRTEFDVAERIAIYANVLRIMSEELPFIFIGAPNRHIARRTSVEGLLVDPILDTYDFSNTTFVP